MNADSTIRLQFDASPPEIAQRLAIAFVGALLIVPFAWVVASIARWGCSRLRFSDGTTCEFRGDGGDIAVWTVLALGLPAAFFFVLGFGGVLVAATIVLWLGAAFMIVKWLVYNAHLSTGPQLTFVGGFGPLALNIFLAMVGILAAHRWLWEQVKGEGIAFAFDAPSGDLFGRTIGALAGTITFLGAPWAIASYAHWWFAHATFRRGVDTSTWQLKDESPRRISAPGGFGG